METGQKGLQQWRQVRKAYSSGDRPEGPTAEREARRAYSLGDRPEGPTTEEIGQKGLQQRR